ncbi:MAG: hypothetical protein BWX86_00539 [Verrucomicrobia bacterium ADurb.Bin122]|nr:MAG: hypothetical protein BWX86_00539 [Verrucomicrobia bacterium ADurb.Bin122]
MPLRIHCLASSSTVIDGIQDCRLANNIEYELARGDGVPFTTFVAERQRRPTSTFVTKKLGPATTLFGLAGYKISATPLDLWFADEDNGGTIGTTGTKVSVTKGIVVPRSLAAPCGQAASLTYELAAAKTDGTAPYAVTDAATFPTGALLDELNMLTGVTIGGVAVPQLRQVSIEWNPRIRTIHADSAQYPILVALEDLQPVIRISTYKDVALSTYLTGAVAAVVITLSKCENGGRFALTGHKTLTTYVSGGAAESLAGSISQPAETELVIQVAWNGTNSPIHIA